MQRCQSLVWLTHSDININGTAAGIRCRRHQGHRQKVSAALKYIPHLIDREYLDLACLTLDQAFTELECSAADELIETRRKFLIFHTCGSGI